MVWGRFYRAADQWDPSGDGAPRGGRASRQRELHVQVEVSARVFLLGLWGWGKGQEH
jgi:hypothetical protein